MKMKLTVYKFGSKLIVYSFGIKTTATVYKFMRQNKNDIDRLQVWNKNENDCFEARTN